jgi:hypothetical protein
MTATLIIVMFAVVSLVSFLFLAMRHVRFAEDSELLPIDLESLATLINKDQREYLKSALTPKQFRLYEREQSLVVAEYVKRISHNSWLVVARADKMRVEDAATQSQLAEMLNLAMQTRTLCLSVLLRLYLNAYTPWFRSPLEQVLSILNAASRFMPSDRADGLTLRSHS